MVPRAWRFICFGLEIRRCRLWATLALILPEAVRLKRFFAPLLVFILGIFGPFEKGSLNGVEACPRRPRAAMPPGRGAGYSDGGGERQGRGGLPDDGQVLSLPSAASASAARAAATPARASSSARSFSAWPA